MLVTFKAAIKYLKQLYWKYIVLKYFKNPQLSCLLVPEKYLKKESSSVTNVCGVGW